MWIVSIDLGKSPTSFAALPLGAGERGKSVGDSDPGDEEENPATLVGIASLYRKIPCLTFYMLALIAAIYVGCEILVCLFHIQPSPDSTVELPALV